MREILLSIFVVSVLIGMTLGILMLIGCSVYDIMAIREKRNPQKVSKTRLKRYRPLVSIVVPAFNEAITIERCLDSLALLRYKKLEVIVSDDCSKDATASIVRRYIRNNPKRSIRLYSSRTNGGRGAAINRGIARSKGEIIVAFDADCVFEPESIHKLVQHFANPGISAVAANVRITDDRTVLTMLQKLEYLVSFRSKKFNTVTNSEFIIGGAGASYRASKLREVGGFDERMKTEDIELSMRMTRLLGKTGGLVYASDYVVHTEAVPSYKALLRQRYRWKFGSMQALFHNRSLLFSVKRSQNPFATVVRLPFALWSEIMLLLEPLFFTTFIYIALANQNPWLFISACLAYAIITWLAIWSDEHYSLRTKIRLSYIAPFMYPASVIISFVQVCAAFRSVANIRSIVGLKNVSGSYVTTQRAGATL